MSAAKRKPRRSIRIFIVGGVFVLSMGAAVLQLGALASRGPIEQASVPERISTGAVLAERALIVDRRGAALAGNAPTYEIYLDGKMLPVREDRAEAADRISEVFPEKDAETLLEEMATRRTVTIKLGATPLEASWAQDLGIPGLYRVRRSDRVYFGGASIAHVVGFVDRDGNGQAGVEGALDARLKASGAETLRISVDLRVQRRVWRILRSAMERYTAKAAAAIVMDAKTGEIVAMVSLPDFDPHLRPDTSGPAAEESPRFHWAVSTGYEPGSTMKLATWALALETGVADMGRMFDLPKTITVDGLPISDHDPFGPISFPMALARSSNVVSATLALEIGEERQRAFFKALGLMTPSLVEVLAARSAKPGWHSDWRISTTATTSYGHGVRISPVQLAEMVGGLVTGLRVEATLLAGTPEPQVRFQVIRPEVAENMRQMMRLTVRRGTGRSAYVEGLDVGGKTGTAEKVIDGVYSSEKVVTFFAAAFPMRDPEYVVVVMLDEPTAYSADGKPVRYASSTAAPTAGEIIASIAPMLGVAQTPEPEE